mmetsp:Transcript_7360/g.18588  ORF Transcript_7360/g.18588 Transcript_7360/m.18588 type:complete len:255 (+) Transcript_7360:225-989(+)|eukprot:CAMPEP_0177654666 /NCGR_PEP_ID=MMETSP0447-20121125/14470_1 /TAXON_ID=0 /ORGANISM="Stygamoeba regulata, Strain BSH-02190019" /LENGTH=254 /DNA_ID=CAMNT_0019158363 /DNA_START=160 /DNA_END=924 /DNA_ORIENTATION=-
MEVTFPLIQLDKYISSVYRTRPEIHDVALEMLLHLGVSSAQDMKTLPSNVKAELPLGLVLAVEQYCESGCRAAVAPQLEKHRILINNAQKADWFSPGPLGGMDARNDAIEVVYNFFTGPSVSYVVTLMHTRITERGKYVNAFNFLERMFGAFGQPKDCTLYSVTNHPTGLFKRTNYPTIDCLYTVTPTGLITVYYYRESHKRMEPVEDADGPCLQDVLDANEAIMKKFEKFLRAIRTYTAKQTKTAADAAKKEG